MCGLVSISETSENVLDLVQAALTTATDVYCLVYAHMCSTPRFLMAVQLLSQYVAFYILDGRKR